MFFIKLFLMCSEHYFSFFLVLIFLACFLSRVYISSYLRMCYFVSKIRGPRAYPIVGNITLLTGSLEESTKNLLNVADKYSPVGRMWIGPVPFLFTKEPRLVQELLTNHELLEKADIMKRIGDLLIGDSILTSEVPKWKHNRNIIIKGFSPIILKSYFKIFTEKIHILTEKLDIELSKGKCFDIFEYLSRATLDSVCGSTMGVNVGAQDLNSSYFNAIQSSLYLMTQRAFNPLLHSELIYRSTKSYKQLRRNENIVKGLTKQIILEKKNDNNAVNNNYKFTKFTDIKRNEYKKPLLEYLLDFSRSNSSFTEKQLEVETNLVIVAAYETTANALSYVILSLAANKNIQNKVYEEVFNVLNESKREKIDFDDLSKLKYMEMVIKESMRLHATAPFIGRKVSHDIHFDNCIIPKGVDVLISIFGLHRNPNFWENPLKFDPERFAPKNIKNCHPYAYIPFSSGARNCIGMRYAWIFMKTALATLLSRYEFHTDLKLDELRFEFEVSLKLIGGHQVRITPRQKCTK